MALQPDKIFKEAVYAGLSGLDLKGRVFEYPLSIRLEETYAHLMSPMLVAFKKPPPDGGPHPAPWRSAHGGSGHDITAQLTIPAGEVRNRSECFVIASTVLFLMRLYSNPAITMPVISNMPFRQIANVPDGEATILPIEHRDRSFKLALKDEEQLLDHLEDVGKNLTSALKLHKKAEFRIAIRAMESGQFLEHGPLILISLWGALEAIFSPSTTELRFRVSALIASYLKPPGAERQTMHKNIVALYDKRSAAAHGKSNHDNDDILETFHILRMVLIEILRQGEMPTRESLEANLFGL